MSHERWGTKVKWGQVKHWDMETQTETVEEVPAPDDLEALREQLKEDARAALPVGCRFQIRQTEDRGEHAMFWYWHSMMDEAIQ